MKERDELRDEAVEVTQKDEDDFDLSKVDWSKAHRGPLFTLKRGSEWVRLEDHVRVIFQGDEEVNDALSGSYTTGVIRSISRSARLASAPKLKRLRLLRCR